MIDYLKAWFDSIFTEKVYTFTRELPLTAVTLLPLEHGTTYTILFHTTEAKAYLGLMIDGQPFKIRKPQQWAALTASKEIKFVFMKATNRGYLVSTNNA